MTNVDNFYVRAEDNVISDDEVGLRHTAMFSARLQEGDVQVEHVEVTGEVDPAILTGIKGNRPMYFVVLGDTSSFVHTDGSSEAQEKELTSQTTLTLDKDEPLTLTSTVPNSKALVVLGPEHSDVFAGVTREINEDTGAQINRLLRQDHPMELSHVHLPNTDAESFPASPRPRVIHAVSGQIQVQIGAGDAQQVLPTQSITVPAGQEFSVQSIGGRQVNLMIVGGPESQS